MPGSPASPTNIPGYVSRYGSSRPRDVSAPGTAFSVGGSRLIGYALAALAALVLGVASGFLSGDLLHLPVVFPLVVGWGIRRALAAGSGGGTPDRGPGGALLLLVIVLASFFTSRFLEYLHAESVGSAHYRDAYGGFPVLDPDAAVASLRARDTDGDGKVLLHDGTLVVIVREHDRLQDAAATRTTPSTPYDIALLASVNRPGFRGHLLYELKEGDTLRLVHGQAGWSVPGVGIGLLWLLDLIVLGIASFTRVD